MKKEQFWLWFGFFSFFFSVTIIDKFKEEETGSSFIPSKYNNNKFKAESIQDHNSTRKLLTAHVVQPVTVVATGLFLRQKHFLAGTSARSFS